MRHSAGYRLFETKTSLQRGEARTLQFYKLDQEPVALLAPSSSAYVYALGETGLLQMLTSSNGARVQMLVDGTGSINLSMAYSSGGNTLHLLQVGETGLQVNKLSVELLPTATSLQSQL